MTIGQGSLTRRWERDLFCAEFLRKSSYKISRNRNCVRRPLELNVNEVRRWGVIPDKNARSVRSINIISQRRKFVARCPSSYVANVFELHSTFRLRAMPPWVFRSEWQRFGCTSNGCASLNSHSHCGFETAFRFQIISWKRRYVLLPELEIATSRGARDLLNHDAIVHKPVGSRESRLQSLIQVP